MGEKTEQPTAKRLSESRDEGKVARSMDLSGAILMIGATSALAIFGAGMLRDASSLMRHVLSPHTLAGGLGAATSAADVTLVFWQTGKVVFPIMALMLVVAYVAQVTQVGMMFSAKVLEPKLNRLSPIAGAKKFFSKRSLVKVAMDVVKLAAIGSVVIAATSFEWTRVLGLPTLGLVAAIVEGAWIVLRVAIWALLILILLGVIDFTYQKWQHTQDLKMTKQEVKDERKAGEGDPETKGRRYRLSRQIAMQRLQSDVPTSDVVVTNPTHFAVALRYDQDSMGAPRVVAKGADYLALKIRYLAAAHGVPIVERPPLARALYADVPVGREINTEHYEAVAEVLAYVYRLEGRAAS